MGPCSGSCGSNLCQGFTATQSCLDCVMSGGCSSQFSACATD
ncbi:MAG: hypothetical protein R3B72_17890 [Polyangiaceae bacterium]